MNLQRITRIQVLVVGAAIIVGVAVLFLLVLINPQLKKIQATLETAETNRQFARGYDQRVADLADAEAEERRVTEEWDKIMETRMPKIDLTDPVAATLRMWELSAEEEALMTRWFDSSGAVVTGYSFQTWPTAMPSSFPSAGMKNLAPLNWNLNIEVGSFPELLDWLRRLPEAPRFLEMQSVAIQGSHGPGQPLVASIPVTLWQWTGVEPTAAPAPAAVAGAGGAQAGGSGAAGGGRRGPGGGMGGRGGGMGGRGGGMGGRGGGMGPGGGRG